MLELLRAAVLAVCGSCDVCQVLQVFLDGATRMVKSTMWQAG